MVNLTILNVEEYLTGMEILHVSRRTFYKGLVIYLLSTFTVKNEFVYAFILSVPCGFFVEG